MVAFKWLYLSAAIFAKVLADDPVVDDAAASAYWDATAAAGVGGDAPEKRAVMAHMSRNTPVMKDPYWGLWCLAPYTEPPCETKCNRNNCFRAFLNARDGSDGKHCPKEAFGFCCIWNSAPKPFRWWAVKTGKVEQYFPWTKNCQDSQDTAWDVVAKIDDVCGCTLDHEVTVDITSDYYGLRHYPCGDKHCH